MHTEGLGMRLALDTIVHVYIQVTDMCIGPAKGILNKMYTYAVPDLCDILVQSLYPVNSPMV